MSWTRSQMCEIIARYELRDGMYVNLGIGMPTGVLDYIPHDIEVIFQSENGMLGMGPFPHKGQEDADLIDAGKHTITELPCSCYISSADSFAMIRGGHIDLTILGGLQVSSCGDLANWTVPGKMLKGMGGAMDLVANVKRVVVIMEHVARDGSHKMLHDCTLPLTGTRVVHRVVTNLGVFDLEDCQMYLIEKHPDVSVDHIRASTSAQFEVRIN
ncbi:CoA transferase subunit B [Rickettsiales endosymbiont of Paramecium tredecaurelia]|uniref:3-oxoacid CoA-transferase subunit B n=1 Tax=Candidatus Sarmatiella mevalonica TaxID=2770581 RepID=UPI0019237C75|nr:3-oxoacid CoA-transferase subunit B [Candidatus Sarmatiella mevalonica]MBL3284616.1 CoA transferase subunit B [Candidatus Sarmatiella mevalonica]